MDPSGYQSEDVPISKPIIIIRHWSLDSGNKCDYRRTINGC